jgi:hypothetical protein
MLYSRFLIFTFIVLYAVGSFSGELHNLARKGDWEEVLSRLSKGAEINERDESGKTLLDIASKSNDDWVKDRVVFELIRMGGENGLNDTTAVSEMSIQAPPSPMQGLTIARRDRNPDESELLDGSYVWPLELETPAETHPPTETQIEQEEEEEEEDSVTRILTFSHFNSQGSFE